MPGGQQLVLGHHDLVALDPEDGRPVQLVREAALADVGSPERAYSLASGEA